MTEQLMNLELKAAYKQSHNLEQTIRDYQNSIEDEGLEPRVDVGINELRTLELIRINNRITAKEIAE